VDEVHLFLDVSAAASARETQWKAFGLGTAPRLPFREGTFEELARSSYDSSDDLSAYALEQDMRWVNAARAAKRPILWVAPHLDEQAFLVWSLQVLARSGVDPGSVFVNVVPRHPGSVCQPEGVVRSALLLGPELEARLAPRRLVASELAFVEQAWTALRSPVPDALLDFIARPATALPWLREGLAPTLHRYPDAHTGLNFWERHLLEAVEQVGPAATRVIAENLACVGVGTDERLATPASEVLVFARLVDFAEGPTALVRLDGDPAEGMRAVKVYLTAPGRDVLAARANALDLIDYDAWIFGVHIDPRRGRAWVRDGDHAVIVRRTPS
jgi:hypothetical protein